MIEILLAVVPVLAVLLLVVVAALPLQLVSIAVSAGMDRDAMGSTAIGPEAMALALSLLPVAAVYFWSVRRPRLLPALAVFACGLVLDVMTQGPLGVWAIAMLMSAMAGRQVRRADSTIGWLRSVANLAGTMALAGVIVGLLVSLYQGALVPVWPLIGAIALAVLFYPLLAALLMLLDGLWPTIPSRSLFLRGD